MIARCRFHLSRRISSLAVFSMTSLLSSVIPWSPVYGISNSLDYTYYLLTGRNIDNITASTLKAALKEHNFQLVEKLTEHDPIQVDQFDTGKKPYLYESVLIFGDGNSAFVSRNGVVRLLRKKVTKALPDQVYQKQDEQTTQTQVLRTYYPNNPIEIWEAQGCGGPPPEAFNSK